jgi:hypothetical protein
MSGGVLQKVISVGSIILAEALLLMFPAGLHFHWEKTEYVPCRAGFAGV